MIETERLVLRGWEPLDLEGFAAMNADSEVMAFIGPLASRDDAETVLLRQQRLQAELGYCFWAIERRDDGVFLGFCGLKPGAEGTPIAGELEAGWRLRRDAWGRGYAREAATASLAWGWANTGVNQIVAITVHGNTRSWGLMERLGMARVAGGEFDHPNVPDGSPLKRHVTYAIARPA
jgi:RimJ/RimL family protein N-acetyltransferase